MSLVLLNILLLSNLGFVIIPNNQWFYFRSLFKNLNFLCSLCLPDKVEELWRCRIWTLLVAVKVTFISVEVQLEPHEPAVVKRAVNHFLQVWFVLICWNTKISDWKLSLTIYLELRIWNHSQLILEVLLYWWDLTLCFVTSEEWRWRNGDWCSQCPS